MQMSSLDMLEDSNQINDFNPFIPGAASLLPGVSNADVPFVNGEALPEPREQWMEPRESPCVDGEVRLGCNAPPHCPLDRNALPSYEIEQGRWSLSGAKCARKSQTALGVDTNTLVMGIALLGFIYYLNRE